MKIKILITTILILTSTSNLEAFSKKLSYIVSSEDFVIIKHNDKQGFMDRKGNLVIEPIYDRVFSFSSGLSTVYKNKMCGYIDKKGKYIIEPKFYECFPFSDGIAMVSFMDNEKDNIVEPKFDENGFIVPEKNKTYREAFINTKGEFIYKSNKNPFEKTLSFSFSDGLGRIFINSSNESKRKNIFINKEGKIIFEPKENIVRDFSEGLAAFEQNNKWGFINKKDEVIIKPIYDSVKDFSEDLAPVEINNKMGFINKKGQIIIKPQFKNAFPFSEGLSRVSLNNKFGYINKKGQIVIEAKYDEVSDFSQGLARGIINSKNYYFNNKGHIIKDFQDKYDLYISK